MKKDQDKTIKNICKDLQCTQIELGKMIGVSTGTVNQWSNGTRTIPNYFFKSIECIKKLKLISD